MTGAYLFVKVLQVDICRVLDRVVYQKIILNGSLATADDETELAAAVVVQGLVHYLKNRFEDETAILRFCAIWQQHLFWSFLTKWQESAPTSCRGNYRLSYLSHYSWFIVPFNIFCLYAVGCYFVQKVIYYVPTETKRLRNGTNL